MMNGRFFIINNRQALFTCIFLSCLLLGLNTPSVAQTSTSTTDRFVALTKEIRCVVCQNQSLADSTAPIATDLRQKIYTLILEKKSDQEIKDYLVKRYGEFILLRPRFNARTLLLWLFPFAGIAAIIGYVLLSRHPTSST